MTNEAIIAAVKAFYAKMSEYDPNMPAPDWPNVSEKDMDELNQTVTASIEAYIATENPVLLLKTVLDLCYKKSEKDPVGSFDLIVNGVMATVKHENRFFPEMRPVGILQDK